MRTGPLAASTTATYDGIRELHRKLVEDGPLALDGSRAKFTRDVVFSSPSAAGAIVTGRSCVNGRTAWVTDTTQTFGQWEQQGLDDAPAATITDPPS